MLGTCCGTTSSASVAASTSRTVAPGPVSPRCARPASNAITASSVTTRSTGRTDVSGNVHARTILGFPLAVWLHGHHDAFGTRHEIHRTAHAGHHLARNHPVREPTLHVDLQATQYGHVDVAATDQAERHRAVERARARDGSHGPATRIGETRLGHRFLGNGSGADQSVLGLKEDADTLRNVIGDQRGNADAEVHQHAVAQLEGDASRDDRLCVHDQILAIR
jgi:hypothetical protein